MDRQIPDGPQTFLADPRHPRLHFKRVHCTEPIYSVRIGISHRGLGRREAEAMI